MEKESEFLQIRNLLFDQSLNDNIIKVEIIPSDARDCSGVPPSLGTKPDDVIRVPPLTRPV